MYNGSSLSQMKVVTQTTANGQTTTATHTLDFSYDASGSPMAVIYNGTTYYYALNLQGDVVAILNGSGSTVVSYTYDAWGCEKACTGTLSGTLGYYNPLRYRGYVYDPEFKLYYLESRYYNPGLSRFINADVLVSTGQGILGNNMFAYCNNNPVCFVDPFGDAHIWFQLFEDHDFGYLHRKVQEHILLVGNVKGVLFTGEFYIPGAGRADIISIRTNEIWEIKHGGSTDTKKLERTQDARSQLKKYLKGNKDLMAGRAGKFNGEFVVNYGNLSYLITYNTPEAGVILYYVSTLPEFEPSPFAVYVPRTEHPTIISPTEALIPFFCFSGGTMFAVRTEFSVGG